MSLPRIGGWDSFDLRLPQRLLALSLGLPPPRNRIRVQRAIPIRMPDGVQLRSDHYAPQRVPSAPTILIRTPYGRGREAPFGAGFSLAELPALRFAERGYHVLVQGVRGCFASEGRFTPHLYEAGDGAATIEWIRQQAWFNGQLGTWGPSYLGYTQWAAAGAVPQHVQAMVPIVTSAEPFAISYPEGAFGLETRLRWAQSMRLLQRMQAGAWHEVFGAEARLQRAFRRLPLLEADIEAAGVPIESYRELLRHNQPNDQFWQMRDHSRRVADVSAPIHLIGGWHDYFLRPLLRDYTNLVAAGRSPYLTIGPWNHTHPGTLIAGLRQGLGWFDRHLRGEGSLRPAPVALFVSGENSWRSFERFPPMTENMHLYLQADGSLAREAPAVEAAARRYTYDPANPTPSVGGAILGGAAGPRDNRALEARPDVQSYTTAALAAPLEVIGMVHVVLFVRSSLAHTDFVGRLCDVTPDGRSINRCDGMLRLGPGVGHSQADGSIRIVIELGPIAHRFRRGHRIRLQISSGAHPRWNRNLGGGEPEVSAVNGYVAHQTLYHDQAHPSLLQLPVLGDDQ